MNIDLIDMQIPLNSSITREANSKGPSEKNFLNGTNFEMCDSNPGPSTHIVERSSAGISLHYAAMNSKFLHHQ
jgi:hypothetical protein